MRCASLRSPLDDGDHSPASPRVDWRTIQFAQALSARRANLDAGRLLSCYSELAKEVGVPILPRDVRKALELLESEPNRPYSIDELAAACGVARRTLQEHFRRFVGRAPSQMQRELRLDRVRR